MYFVGPRPAPIPKRVTLATLGKASIPPKEKSAEPLSFVQFVDLIYPSYIWYRHSQVLAAALQRIADGELKRLMVFMPPRSGKSIQTSRLFPAYLLYRFPQKFTAIASYGAELAYTFSRAARGHFEDAGGILKSDARAIKHWETQEGGGLWAAGVGGAATGKGFSYGLIDDVLKSAEEAGSAAIKAKHKDWYSSVWYTRGEPDAALVIVQTRWAQDDLSGWLLDQEQEDPEGWHIINFEAIKSEAPPNVPQTCTVEPDWRHPGEALCPERFDYAKLYKIKQRIGEYFWAALYQQHPRPAEGNLIKISWFRRYRALPAESQMIIQSWDTASKAKELSAYSVCATWMVDGGRYYLADIWRDRVEMPELERMVFSLAEKWQPNAILVEDKASGTGVIQLVRAKAWLPLIPINPEADKITRLAVESPAIEAGKVWLPEQAPWLPEFENELLSAPNGAFMDQCDAVSQFLRYMRSQQIAIGHHSTGRKRIADGLGDFLAGG